ncbi:MAG: hypothetical protein H7070_07510, partial [Saprospiraceae bacterium]|nr:hypothetical protein [Pyrinomonadaceae bacterium]
MGKIVLSILIGLIVGGALTFYFFVGVPQAAQLPGAPIQPPDASGSPGGTAQISLGQDFFNEVLTTIFRDMNAPSFPIGAAGASSPESAACASKITVLREGSGVQTGLRFENNTIAAPLAFTGSYSSPFGCLQFTGWAKANFELRYDASQQVVFGRINVETVNLDGVNPIVGALVTPLVQSTLNDRVNPIQILQGSQISVIAPIVSASGNLQAAV